MANEDCCVHFTGLYLVKTVNCVVSGRDQNVGRENVRVRYEEWRLVVIRGSSRNVFQGE